MTARRVRIALHSPRRPKGVLYFGKSMAAALEKQTDFTPTRPPLVVEGDLKQLANEVETAAFKRSGDARERRSESFLSQGEFRETLCAPVGASLLRS
jgi:hypothetical protein